MKNKNGTQRLREAFRRKIYPLFGTLSLLSLIGCKTTPFGLFKDADKVSAPESSGDSNALSYGLKNDFCSGTSPQFWNRSEVQAQIKSLLDTPGYSASGLSTYAEIYLRMTDKRDDARCQPTNPMYPKSAFSRAVNDRLADIMTKSFVAHQRMCFAKIQGKAVVLSYGANHWCEYMKKSLLKKESALTFAMGSTALYLSHTMPIALSAVIHDASLWREPPFQSIEARTQALLEYRSTYDAFNSFLSSHLRMIVDVLTEQKRISCKIFAAAVSAAQRLPLAESIFKEIRDRSFQRGVSLASQWPLGFHPYLQGSPNINVERSFDPTSLANQTNTDNDIQFALSRLQNPYMKFFNGKDAKAYLADLGFSCSLNK